MQGSLWRGACVVLKQDRFLPLEKIGQIRALGGTVEENG